MSDSQTSKNWYSQDLEQRKNWYSQVANAYNKTRPRYPQAIIDRVVELTQLGSDSSILEIGCGPGNATLAFAQLGLKMVCLEPSPAACDIARQNCAAYPQVEIHQTLFEDWELEPAKFNAVLAATSLHWVTPEIAYRKTAAALQDNGFLILLWNMTPQPQYAVYQKLREVYQIHAPSLGQYEDRNTQERILQGFGQKILDSGLFEDLISENIIFTITYHVDDYLLLLSTLSPYIGLDANIRIALFAGLKDTIEQHYQGMIEISFLSAFHIARKSLSILDF
ncbi:bifunctional 2-polyprenyl-6-hydroxyphenol methylase/3-demethylubiquinol 3-O-methyltransferase UbiG [Nostoc sp. TCL26-01]|uniref:class I SAM-dependent methyltransferase n=1 Tax=Nostoc sp. TCL26-01 TaxID=2576904 RepID=UPI0015BF7BDB|nr:class I SAM-dependent methyltransferase [Nostoc sp. TCL26-01]QLE56541.1 class I SAM-dependent methyltransferase [Nostoc sp. TCL26-01]